MSKIISKDFQNILSNYGAEFSKVLNIIYEEEGRKFSLNSVTRIYGNSYLCTVFKYGNNHGKILWDEDTNRTNPDSLVNLDLSKHLRSKRIIRLYDKKDAIVIIKPNQYRYWLSLMAYRDADKSIVDLSKAGY